MRLPSRLLPGAPLLGFAAAFDDATGSADTPWPYPVVVPSAVGPALLPFPCPHCGAVKSDVVDPDRRSDYFDRLRKFTWCPACRGRYFLDRKGEPLVKALPAGATSAPARVERPAGKVIKFGDFDDVVLDVEEGRFDLLGAVSQVGCCLLIGDRVR